MSAEDAALAARSRRRHEVQGERRSRTGPTGLDADVEAFLADVDRRLRPYLERAASRVPAVAPLNQAVANQLAGGGKRVRAALCVAACELFGTPFADGLDFAAAIEHVHNFTLVHDDIADADAQRRGQPSVWKQYGVGHAINIGDAFVPLAAAAILNAGYADALKLRLLALVAEQALEMVEGQSLDLNMRCSDSASPAQYLECTARKTGAFIAMATVGGGLIGGAAERDLQRLREFGRLGGVSFQIRDDLLDREGTKGRRAGSDVLEGKRTLLVIEAARKASAPERRRLFRILDKPRHRTSASEVEWVWALFRRTGAAEYAARAATDLADQACEQLQEMPESAAKYRLLRLARYLDSRGR
jgi:geranylgeranyl diphosphate synthase type I